MQIRLTLNTTDIEKVNLSWECQTQANENLNNFSYNIQISGSKNGDWLTVNQKPLYDVYGYIDNTTQRGFMNNDFYYRIEAISSDGLNLYYSNLVHLDESNTNYIVNFIAKQEQRALRRLNGQKALLFQKKKFGNRCGCYDKIMKKRIVQNCPDCFNTTYEGGYYNPVLIWINRPDVRPISPEKNENGVMEQPVLNGWTSNDAIINPDDVVIFMNTANERFMVDSVIPTKFQGCTLRQILKLVQKPLDSEIYKLKYDTSDFDIEEYNVYRRSWVNK